MHGLTEKDLLEAGGESLNGEDVSLQSLFENASFAVKLFPEYGIESLATVWGLGDGMDLTVDGSGSQSLWSGGLFSGHFGFDTRLDQGLLAGMAVSVSEAGLDSETGSGNELNFNALSSGVSPYFGMESLNGETRLHVVSGFRQSQIRVKEADYADETASSNYYSLGISGRNRLYSSDSILTGGTSELNASMESWMSHQIVNDNRGYIDDLHVNVGFYGFDLEGVHSHELNGGGEITPSILLGLRGYDWNGDNSYGLLLNGSAGFTSPVGLSLDGSSYLEFSGFNHIQRRGIQGNIEFDSGNDELGILLSTTSSWGQSSLVPGRLLRDINLLGSEMEQSGQEDGFSLESEIWYGFSQLDGTGILTPHLV